MHKKKIVQLFGCGNIAKEFYQNYKDRITITGVISNNPKEMLFCPVQGEEYEVKRPGVKKVKDACIVICSCDYENIAEQLILLGYTPMKDFIDYELAALVLDERKPVLLYGMCHLRGIKEYVMLSKSFRSQYHAIYYPNYLSQNAYQQMRMNYLVDSCRVFIYGEALTSENYRKNTAILERLNSDVKILCLHTVYFGGYFPQKNRVYNAMNQYAVKAENYDYTPFSYNDSWMNECIDKGMSASAIVDLMNTPSCYNRDDVLRYLDGEWRRLTFQERESDFKILDYIRDNYKKMRLFRNEAHMENNILYQYAVQVLKYLDCNDNLPMPEEPLLKCSQHCIFPGVADILQLEWDVRKEMLELYTYSGWKRVTLAEYVNTYVEMCSDIRKWKKKNLLP